MRIEHSAQSKFGTGLGSLILASLALLAFAAAPAAAKKPAPGGTACPSFRVLHNDRIGTASLPAGNYLVTPSPSAELSCADASRLFTRFLQDWDGNLPRPWAVVAKDSGTASFSQDGRPGFTVEREAGGGSGPSPLGARCPGTFTVNAGAMVGPLSFPKGSYLLYIPPRSAITCRRASILFTRFLAAPGGMLPDPWRLKNQTATFFKPAHPARSVFLVEPPSAVS